MEGGDLVKIAIAILLVAMAGCTVVPATRVLFNPVTHELVIRSPKDIAISNLVARLETNGTATVTIGSYSSYNNAEVIAAVAVQNARMLKAAAEIGGQGIGTAVKHAK